MTDLSDYIRHSQPTEEARMALAARLAEAERRGLLRAADELRNSERYLRWYGAALEDSRKDITAVRSKDRRQLADYLEVLAAGGEEATDR